MRNLTLKSLGLSVTVYILKVIISKSFAIEQLYMKWFKADIKNNSLSVLIDIFILCFILVIIFNKGGKTNG